LTDETDQTDGRLAELERRLGRIEDERAIERMIASYGPLVDAGEADATAGLMATPIHAICCPQALRAEPGEWCAVSA
jgi:hypothetical protein